ncbi:MAG: hypothetical protein PHR28_02595 [candidate division Zixibacteria bacterium]|nr:hypothetical protein [candidate division Zixibacteria bacterium]
MENLAGCLVARLADRDEAYEGDLVDEINRVVNPPKPVGADEVYIRAMYIVSDQVNSQGGRFAEEEIDRLTELLIDAPVMVGHRRDSLPLARNFKAVKIRTDDRVWVKSYFYWMKESDGAEALKNNIDGGIYKECSISFLFLFPECSICGRDIRQCHHVPFNEYETASGGKEIAHFLYRRIEKVLETSLVFRGSVADTRITDKLSSETQDDDIERTDSSALFSKVPETAEASIMPVRFAQAPLVFRAPDRLASDHECSFLLTYPHQPGITATAVKKDGAIELISPQVLANAACQRVTGILSQLPAESFELDFLLYATRGNDRLNGFGLAHLLGSETNLHRLRIRLCDGGEIDGRNIGQEPYENRLEAIRQLAGKSAYEQLDVMRPQRVVGEEWPAYLGAARWKEYNFGLEAVGEGNDGRLSRLVFTRENAMPGMVEAATVREMNRLDCTVALLDGRKESCRIMHPKAAGLESGAVVLLRGTGVADGQCRGSLSIIDIFPGKGRNDIKVESSLAVRSAGQLVISPGADSMMLRFPLDNVERCLTVHHFSPRLFALGRRFVADMSSEQTSPKRMTAGEAVPLEAVTCLGRLILLRLSGNNAVMGDCRRLWIRPVLLDGVERYLFYGERVSGPR